MVMRIACVVEEFPVLSETFILNQITGLIDRGHEVDLYAFGRRDRSHAHEDVLSYKLLDNIRYAPSLSRNKIKRLLQGLGIALGALGKSPCAACGALNVFRFGKYVASMRLIHEAQPFFGHKPYDVVHAHFGQVGARLEKLRKLGLLSGKFITTFYGFDISQRVEMEGKDFYLPLFAEADHVLALSELMRGQLLDIGCPPDKAIVHHLGADARRFEFLPRRLEGNGPIRIVSVARLAEKKGLEYAVRAVAKVKETSSRPIRYRVIGDGELRDQLTKLIDDLNVGDVVELAGWKTQTQVVEALNESHIFMAPSVTAAEGDQEGTPTAIAEALLMGLPILSTLHSGIPEMVQDGKSGYLVPERDVDALADRLGRLVGNPGSWAPMGQAGRSYAEAEFDINRLNDKLVSLYQA